MTHRGPFQPLLFCDSVKSLSWGCVCWLYRESRPSRLLPWRICSSDCPWTHEQCKLETRDPLCRLAGQRAAPT